MSSPTTAVVFSLRKRVSRRISYAPEGQSVVFSMRYRSSWPTWLCLFKSFHAWRLRVMCVWEVCCLSDIIQVGCVLVCQVCVCVCVL